MPWSGLSFEDADHVDRGILHAGEHRRRIAAAQDGLKHETGIASGFAPWQSRVRQARWGMFETSSRRLRVLHGLVISGKRATVF